jgi:hypothetical protein
MQPGSQGVQHARCSRVPSDARPSDLSSQAFGGRLTHQIVAPPGQALLEFEW